MVLGSLDYSTAFTAHPRAHCVSWEGSRPAVPSPLGPLWGGNDVAPLCQLQRKPSRPALSLRKWIFLFSQRQTNRRAGKVEGLTQSVDQIAPIVVRHRIGAAAEEDESRRPALRLGQVVEPDAPAGDRRRRMRGGDLG